MAPPGCKGNCWFCPLKRPIQVTDRVLRATYFAAICLKAAVPGQHPNLNCMINCIETARDVAELMNCVEDYHDLYWWTVHKSDRKALTARQLDQVSSAASLLSSFVTTGAIFHDYGLLNLGRYGAPAADWSRALSFIGHACSLGSQMTAQSWDNDALCQSLTSISEGSYMALEFFIDRASIPVQGAIGISTALWGILT